MLAHASHEPLSAVNALIGSIMVPVVSSATVSSIMVSKATGVDGFGGQRSQTQFSTMPIKPVGVAQASSEPVSISSAPIVSALVTWTSQVATEDAEGSATTNNNSDLEGVHLLGPTIRELFGD